MFINNDGGKHLVSGQRQHLYYNNVFTAICLHSLQLPRVWLAEVFGASPRWAYVLILAQKQVFEGVFEGSVAQGVAGRVDGAVDVAEPVADGPEGVGNADGTEGVDQDHDVVRCPCDHEGNQDGHDGARHLFLPWRKPLPLPLGYCVLLSYLWNMSREKRFSHLKSVLLHPKYHNCLQTTSLPLFQYLWFIFASRSNDRMSGLPWTVSSSPNFVCQRLNFPVKVDVLELSSSQRRSLSVKPRWPQCPQMWKGGCSLWPRPPAQC